MTKPQEKKERRLSPLTRLLLIIAGADPDMLANCPQRDIHNVLTIACLLLIVWVWQGVLFTMVGHMMLARPGEWRFDVVAGGILIATVVLLVDSYVIVRSSWSLQGLSDLKRGGLDLPSTTGARVKNGIFIAVRLLLSTVLAMLTALFLSILLFEKDITANLEQEFQKKNSALLARITGQVDDAIAKLKSEHEEIRARLSAMAEEEKAFRATVIDPASDNTEFKAALDRVAALNEAKAEAQRELITAEKLAADELGGARGSGTSGIAGYGPLRRAADEKVASVRRKVAAAVKDIEEAQKQVEALREGMKDVSSSKRGAAEAKLAEIGSQRTEKQDRLARVESELHKREQDRDRAVRTAFENDPGYRNKEEGFLARLEGLDRISEAFHVKFVVIIFHIGLFGVELAAVLAKIATFIPSSYATILACQDYKAIVERVRALVDEINKLGPDDDDDPPAGAPASLPVKPPRHPQPGGAAIPAAAEDIGEALRRMFPQAQPSNIDVTPPHNDTAFRKRRGRPSPWRPRLRDGDPTGESPA